MTEKNRSVEDEIPKTAKEWAWFFYRELGYRIVEDEEEEQTLQKAMEKVLRLSVEPFSQKGSLEGEIKAKAKTTHDIISWGLGIKSRSKINWVQFDDVLVVLRQHEATHKQQLQEWLANPEVLDQFALLEHEQWTHWMQYMDKRAIHGITTVEFTSETWDEWLRKGSIHYCDLTESEKESDRKFALKVLQKFQGLKP